MHVHATIRCMYVYSEDAVFGPLTLKQFLALTLGGAIAWLMVLGVYPYGEGIAAVCGGITIALAYHLRPTKIEGEEAVRAHFQNPEGARRLQKKIAELTAQLGERKAKGFADNAPVEEALAFLEKIAHEHTPTPR